jgi:3-deoxy-manno-octulosonate cytidylyltransferase (CMP-KDO synthetase)
MKVIGVIPCRFNSSRFPGKSIANILGEPMLVHVWRRASKAQSLNQVVVATDDDRIAQVARNYGIEVVMTSDQHSTGTDRVSEVASEVEGDLFVNIQGDEPMIDPDAIDSVVSEAISRQDTQIFNGYTVLNDKSRIEDRNIVKVLCDFENFALAFSRLPIPFAKEETVEYKRQLGLYAIRKSVLREFVTLDRGPLERSEGVEMYRFLENGFRIKMIGVKQSESLAVDIPDDIEKVERALSEKSYE